jgi:hypothetical protein
MNVHLLIFLPQVPKKIEVPIQIQFGMVTSLQENLIPPHCHQLIDLGIDLCMTQYVVIRIFLGSIKRAEFTVDVADIRVVDVSIHDIGNHLLSLAPVIIPFGQISPHIGQFSQLR